MKVFLELFGGFFGCIYTEKVHIYLLQNIYALFDALKKCINTLSASIY